MIRTQLSLPRADSQVQSLIRKVRSHQLCGTAKKKKKTDNDSLKKTVETFQLDERTYVKESDLKYTVEVAPQWPTGTTETTDHCLAQVKFVGFLN